MIEHATTLKMTTMKKKNDDDDEIYLPFFLLWEMLDVAFGCDDNDDDESISNLVQESVETNYCDYFETL